MRTIDGTDEQLDDGRPLDVSGGNQLAQHFGRSHPKLPEHFSEFSSETTPLVQVSAKFFYCLQ